MKPKLTWRWMIQLILVAAIAVTLKLYYSSASADQLRWILAPTTALVELVTGTRFEFESRAGYLSADHSFLIAPSCAGVNFLITAFLLLTVGKLLRERSQKPSWGVIPVKALAAYVATLAANAVRIGIALRLPRAGENGLLNHAQLHRTEGIIVYFGFLLLLFAASERGLWTSTSTWLRRSLFPLLLYYVITIGIPLLNGGYHQGFEFWEHSAFVLLIPLFLLAPLVVVGLAVGPVKRLAFFERD